jgi:hypothetical protein
MFRTLAPLYFVACLASALSAADRKFAEPLNVAKELATIEKEFPGPESKPARDAALAQLAAAAEAAKSTEYAALRQLYLKLGRVADAVKMQGLIALERAKGLEAGPANPALPGRPTRPAPLAAQPPASVPPPATQPTANPALPARPAPTGAQPPAAQPPASVPPPASQPGAFNLVEELRKVNEQFNVFKSFPPRTPREGPEYEKFMADRKQALAAVAAAAEAAKSTNHVALANLYGDLERYDDAVREVRAYMAKTPGDLKAFWPLLNYLCKGKRLDDALLAFRQWLAIEISLSDSKTYLEPLEYGLPSPVRSLVILLLVAGRYDDAAQVRSEMRTRIEQLLAQYDKGPVPAGLLRPTISNALGSVSSLSAAGVDYDVERLSRSALRIQLEGILARYRGAPSRAPGAPVDPDAEKRNAERAAALAALAATPEAAQSADLPTLLKLYSLLDRADEALDAQRRWLVQDVPLADVPRFVKHLGGLGEARDLVQLLIHQGKFVEGWQAIGDLGTKLDHLLKQYDQGPAPKHYSRPEITNAMLDVVRLQQELCTAEVKSCVDAGKTAQAEQSLDRWQASLSKWAATLGYPRSPFHTFQSELDALRASLKK